MSRWFRMHSTNLNNAKVQRLPPETFRAWVNLLCIACEHGGALPEISDISFALRCSDDLARAYITQLTAAKLIDDVDGTLHMHDWNVWQYQSDSSTPRVRKHRNGTRNDDETLHVTSPETARNVSVTPPDTESDTDSESDTEQKQTHSRAPRRAGVGYSDDFQVFWKAYPPLTGNPKAPAWAEWQRAALDVDPQIIIAAAKRYAEASSKADAPKVAHARTWLHQKRWNDWGGPECGAKTLEEREADELALYKTAVRRFYAPGPLNGSWGESYLGPPPGAPGCRVPAEILAAHGPQGSGGATLVAVGSATALGAPIPEQLRRMA